MDENEKCDYKDLLDLTKRPIVDNQDCFECVICFTSVHPGDGVVLKNCLHSFCKNCLINTIKFSEEFFVNCPFMNCEAVLQETEIKLLLNAENWEKHLEKSIRVAQSSIKNSYMCRTPNCKGWCIFESGTKFICPICNIENCLVCCAIHPEYDCDQYQEMATVHHETKAEIDNLIAQKLAMHCPTCRILVIKDGGCEHMNCGMCKSDFNWKY